MKFKTLIVDDEKESRDGIERLLSLDNDIEVLGKARNGLDAIEHIQKNRPDLLLLDIQMPNINGFEVLNSINHHENPINVIFITAFDQYALKAFDVHAIDYLLKPFSDSRFKEAIERAKKQIQFDQSVRQAAQIQQLLTELQEQAQKESASGIVVNESKESSTRIVIKASGKIIFVHLDDVIWVEADNYYVTIHCEGKKHLVRSTMKEIGERLPSETFLRIHKSTIINTRMIKELIPHINGEYRVIVEGEDKELKVSRSYKNVFNEWLKKQ